MARGRSHRSAKKRRLLLEVIASGKSVTAAARAAGMSRRAVYDWKLDDPSFAADLAAAYDEGTDNFADALMDRALLPDHDGLAIMLLRQRDIQRYGKRLIEVRVTDNANTPPTIENREGAWIFPRDELKRPNPAKLLSATAEEEPDRRDPEEAGEATIEKTEDGEPEDKAA
jgi:hypothetical protein